MLKKQDVEFLVIHCSEYYESSAILLQEEALMLNGLMLGLNCIDCHLNIRDNTSLDDPVGDHHLRAIIGV